MPDNQFDKGEFDTETRSETKSDQINGLGLGDGSQDTWRYSEMMVSPKPR